MNETLVARPIRIELPPCGVVAAESHHGSRFHMAAERHTFNELYYLLRGELTYHEHGTAEPLHLREGAVYPITAGLEHRVEDRTQATLLLLCLGARFMSGERGALWSALGARRHRVIYPNDGLRRRVEDALRRIMAEQAAPRLGADLAIRAEATRLLVELARLPDRAGPTTAHARVAQVLADMEETFYEAWDLDAAARRAGLSRRRFSELCRELTGATFLERLSDLRLTHAARRLAEGQTIAGAAFSSGFGDLASFYRRFGRRFGCPPGRWLSGQRAPSRPS